MNPTPGNFLSASPGGYSKTAIAKRQTNKTEKSYTMLALKSDSWQPNNFRLSDDQVILRRLHSESRVITMSARIRQWQRRW
jgi:hypothetical protein